MDFPNQPDVSANQTLLAPGFMDQFDPQKLAKALRSDPNNSLANGIANGIQFGGTMRDLFKNKVGSGGQFGGGYDFSSNASNGAMMPGYQLPMGG